MRTLKKSPPIAKVDREVRKRAAAWEALLARGKNVSHLVNNKNVRSSTVLALTGSEEVISRLKQKAKRKGFLLGEGYGSLKATSFRIANFPALKPAEIRQLMQLLGDFI